MGPEVWLPLACCVASAATASALTARGVGARANRMVALVLAANAWWSLCEVLTNVQHDPAQAAWFLRASSLGWMMLGPLALDLVAEILGDARTLRRLAPWAYGSAAVAVGIYALTPWGLPGVWLGDWGWTPRFGPAFPLLYGTTVGWLAVALGHWPRLLATAVAHERRQANIAFVAIATAAGVATVSEVVLPAIGFDVPRLGNPSILVMGLMLARGMRRYGYFLLAPGAYAPEILAALRDGVAMLEPDGTVRRGNAALARILDAPIEEIEGRPIAEFLPELEEPGAIGRLHDTEIELWPCDGETVPVSASASRLEDERGRLQGHVLALRDLREVTSLRKRLVTSGRLAAVGELAAGIAGEIAGPVASVRTDLLALRQRWEALAGAVEKQGAGPALEPLLGEGEELIEESLEGVDRVAAVVRDVAAVSQRGGGRSERLDLNQLVDSVLGVAVLSFSVMVERCYGELPPVRGRPQQLRQAFLDLILNALHAVGDFGRIRIATQAQAGRVTVRVQDDGPGIDDGDIERIFDPFFTTRPGQGLGLGLVRCFQAVRAHGGEISVYSTPGRGSVFEVTLPSDLDG